ncbi:MAG: DNA-protecting protein DprA [Rhodobacteraceae bacterium]|nr:DNA-protecting protein DprA [Paracoccaceae bacterium]
MAKDFSTSSTPSLTPPLTEEERLDWLRLLRSRRVGISTFFRLLQEHGTAKVALDALPAVAAEAGVKNYAPFSVEDALAELRAGEACGAKLIAYGEDGYPAQLTELTDPPPLIWAMGRLELLAQPMIALVGARNASSLGTRMAKKLATDLSDAGHVVVSGLARGVDTAAHLAAIQNGTVAVMAGGVDVIYPAENAALAQEIGEKGVRLSEQPMHLQPAARHFPRRNRLISGLSRAVVVVEAAAKSGSLITARNALDQGREVLAVPGHPFDARASGCNMLIRDGATLVRGSDDVLEAIAPVATAADQIAETEHVDVPAPQPERLNLAQTAALHTEILARLGPSPVSEDQLIRDLDRAPALVTPELVTLELDGRISRQPGGLLSKSD